MERFVEVAEGVSLWVESRGPEDAPAILLIMGSTVSGLVWPDELVEVLARKHRVIRYDHRDTGASSWAFDRVPYSATRMAEDALAILDAFGIERAHVVGLSLGGLLVQWLLVAHPERLLSATVIGAPALEGAPARANLTARAPVDPGLYEFWRHMFEPREREAQLDWRVENWRRLNGGAIPFDAEEFRALEQRIIAHAGRHDTSDAHARVDPSGLARGAELAHVTVPTLVIATPEDPTNPESNSRFLAETLPRSTLVTIDGMGHAIPRAVVPRLAAALLSHIERRMMKTGGCACGAVRYGITLELTPVTFCHCSKCRRWHGHVGAYTAVDRPGFELTEQRGLRWYAASATVRRGFCGECGSSLFWDEEGAPKMSICAGTFDAPTGLTPKAHIYLGSKGDYYEVPDDGLIRREEFTR